MMRVSRRQFFAYTVLPGFAPRLKELFMTGFQYVPYFIALVYQSVRLLPANHPYGNAANIGRYGIRHVVAEAANNLVISRRNLDQIVLFVTILLGLILIIVQFTLLGLSMIFQPVMAATNFADFFVTPVPEHDLAYIFLDLVFGVEGMFDSCVAAGGDCQDARGDLVEATSMGPIGPDPAWPYPIHFAMHDMFALYSTGLLVVAAFITSYFIFTVIAETAQEGQAFGKRFNKVWAPVRIIMAFGLLIPLGSGLNSAQYLVLYAAKYGSSFATNGWLTFNNSIGAANTYLGAQSNLVTTPNTPDISQFIQFLYTASTCRDLEEITNGTYVEPYLVKDPLTAPNDWFMLNDAAYYGAADEGNFTTYEELIDFADGANRVTVRFGVRDPANYSGYKGSVKPICGEFSFQLTDPRVPGSAEPPEAGTELLQRYYWFIFQELWYIYFYFDPVFGEAYPYNTALRYLGRDTDAPLPDSSFKSNILDFYSDDLEDQIDAAVVAQAASPSFLRSAALSEKGWAGASIWYNQIADLNGRISTVVYNTPSAVLWPEVMEEVLAAKKGADRGISISSRFEPTLADGKDVHFTLPGGSKKARALNEAFKFFQSDAGASSSQTAPGSNIFIDTIKGLLGTNGLYSMRRNPTAHPLAQLVGIGRSLVEASMRSTLLAGISGGIGGLVTAATLEDAGAVLGKAGVGFMMTIAMITMTTGFVLFYIIPFLPFIYFFFAIGGWIKAIFEAMVGAPLWALAHIRIDGNGLPGHAAVNGYFLIFEIFLRPILIVFGLLASISIFSALILILNQTWDIVTGNLTGFDIKTELDAVAATPTLLETIRGPVDQFFYTVVYAIIAYLMAMSSFKLIDLIPGNILRWMGQSVSTFSDGRDDMAQGLVSTSAIGAQQTISSVGGGLQSAAQKMLTPKPKGP